MAGEDKPEVIGATEVVTEEAIEAEDQKKQSRLLRKGGIVFCILLIAIIVPVAVVVPGGGEKEFVNKTESPTMAPSSSPTGALFADLLDTLRPLYPDDETFEQAFFSSDDTPQAKALDWATNVAPLDLAGDDPRMVSRFSLATFYFSTNGDDWERCGVGSTNCDEGREWLTADNECDWLAIECADPDAGDYTVFELFFREYYFS